VLPTFFNGDMAVNDKTTIWGRELPLVVIQNKPCMDKDFPGVKLPRSGEKIDFDTVMEGKPVHVLISMGNTGIQVWRVRISEKTA